MKKDLLKRLICFWDDFDPEAKEILKTHKKHTEEDFLSYNFKDLSESNKIKDRINAENILDEAINSLVCPKCSDKLEVYLREKGRYIISIGSSYYCSSSSCDFSIGDIFGN